MGLSGQLYAPAVYPWKKEKTGGWVGPRPILDVMEKKTSFVQPEIEPRLLSRPDPTLITTLTELFPLRGWEDYIKNSYFHGKDCFEYGYYAVT
jgi:hypothetical protein